MKPILGAVAVTALFALAVPLAAEMTHTGHGMAQSGEADTAASAATDAFRAVAEVMHEAMNIEYTGDADVDFVRGMIAHHQGAIDMARVVIDHGKDPEIRKLAQDIIAAQEGEIAFMRGWLEQHGQ